MSSETITTFLFELANFAALAGVLGWLFFKPVRQAISEQTARVQSLEDEALKKLADADEMRREVATQREHLATELEQQRKKSLDRAKEEAADLMEEARLKVERDRQKLQDDAANIQRALFAKTADAVAKSASLTVARLLKQMSGVELDEMLVLAACSELAGVTGKLHGAVTIETSSELGDDARRRLESVIGDDGSAHYRVVPELDGGLRVSTKSGLIDASISGLAKFAEEVLLAELNDSLREESIMDEPLAVGTIDKG